MVANLNVLGVLRNRVRDPVPLLLPLLDLDIKMFVANSLNHRHRTQCMAIIAADTTFAANSN